MRVLDVGCGSGWLAHQCTDFGASVFAIDIGIEGVRGARDRYTDVRYYQVGDLYSLPFVDEKFDALVLSEVLEHLEDIPKALSEAARVLKPGGRIIVSVPHKEKIIRHLCIHCNKFTPGNAHLHSFDVQVLKGLCHDAGFSVSSTYYTGNKLLEVCGFPLLSRRWPYRFWQLLDSFANLLLKRPAFLAICATKIDQ